VDRTAYWQYLKNSLDIDDFMLPPLEPKADLYNVQAELGFFTAGALTGEEKALFEKMIAAMGLSLERVGLFLSKAAADSSIPSRVRVAFSDDEQAPGMGTWQEVKGARIFTTHSLKNLLRNPALKKSAWEHLKTVRAALAQ
jgi:hypothetical protein